MLAIIILTSLVTFLIFILSAAAYLISVIIDESDDDVATSTLGLDTDDFSTTPVISPVDITNGSLINVESLCPSGTVCNCLKSASVQNSIKDAVVQTNARQTVPSNQTSIESNSRVDADPRLIQGAALLADTAAMIAEPEDIQSAELNSKLLKASESQREPDETSAKGSNLDDQSQQHESLSISSWQSSAAAQKNIISSQLGSAASKVIFEDFDTKEMQLGGTALHWCKSRRSLDRLIKLGLPTELVNKRHETALHVAIRKHNLQVIIGLLNQGANIESRNENGETPLIIACKVNDIFAVQLLLIYDADFDAIDNLDQSGRHLSASICDKHKSQQQLPSAAHLILAMLNEVGAARCKIEQSKPTVESSIHHQANNKTRTRSACTDGCSHSGSYNGNSYNRWLKYDRESLYKRCMFNDIIEKKLKTLRTSTKQSTPGSRILCMDGGGLRGIIICQIMIEMEKYLKKPMLSYFDWVGGTSVGAFLACALCKGLTMREMRRVCFEFKDEVFSGTRPYNSKFLERVLKRTYGSKTRLSEIKNKKVAIATVLADRDPCQLKIFRNYKSPAQLLEAYGFSAEKYNIMSSQSIVSNGGRRRSYMRATNVRQPIDMDSSKAIHKLPIIDKTMQSQTKEKDNDKRDVTSQMKQSDSDKSEASISNQSNKGQHLNKDSDKSNEIISSSKISAKIETSTSDQRAIKEALECILDENDKDPIIWQAVRASAAAPFFFKPYGPYLDGGIISNNPTMDLITEFTNHQSVRRFIRNHSRSSTLKSKSIKEDSILDLQQPEKLDLVVSLGTGRGKIIGRQAMVDFGQIASGLSAVFSPVELVRSIRAARDLFKRLMQQSCHTDDHIIDRAQAWCSSIEVPYFRLNPPLATIFSIDDKRDEQLINALWQTKLYMMAMKDQLTELAELLEGQTANQSKSLSASI